MGETAAEMREQIEARKAEEAGKYRKDETGKPVVDSEFTRRCIWDLEVGDGRLYATLMRDAIIYNNNADEWLVWDGHSWRRDSMQLAMQMTSVVHDAYADELKLIREEEKSATTKDAAKYLENLREAAYTAKKRMLRNAGRKNCLMAAVSINDPLAISGDELNRDPWLLACRNGVINLKTGEFGPGRQEQYITVASPIDWQGIDAPAERWTRFLQEIFGDDPDKIKYFLKILGYAITGNKNIHIFPVLYGKYGRNGKSTIVNILYHILGPMAGPIPTEMLLRQRNGRSPSGPSPDIMSLCGRRIAVASEPNEGERFDMGKVKFFTGGEKISGRNPHDKYPIEFDPTHTLFLLTNEKPGAKYDDNALWARLRCFDFPFSFIAEPKEPFERLADENLEDDLKKEAPGILASIVRGTLLWRKEGLIVPDSVRRDTESWRISEDQLAEFLEECCETGDNLQTGSTDMYVVFANWWVVNRNKKMIPGSRKFGEWMGAKFAKKKSGGSIYYIGVQLAADLPAKYIIGPNN